MAAKTNFDDVGDFHEKFELPNVTHRGPGPRGNLRPELMRFRMNFMFEELQEFANACGYTLDSVLIEEETISIDHEKAFDALLDLAYVVFGTAQVMGYPWQEGWDEVQRANITKERCTINHAFVPPAPGLTDPSYSRGCYYRDEGGTCGEPRSKHSLRGSASDVIKPKGWMPPSLKAILEKVGFK